MADDATRVCVGDPDTLLRQGTAAGCAGTRLQELIDLLDADVTTLVPQRWDGKAATGFLAYWRRLTDAMGMTGGLAETWQRSLRTNAAIMEEAKGIMADALLFMADHHLELGPDLTVVSRNQVDPSDATAVALDRAAVATAQNWVNQARAVADGVRQRLRDTNEQIRKQLHEVDVTMVEMAVTAPFPASRNGLRAAAIGRRVHQWITDGLRPFEGTLLRGGKWRVFSVERRVGGAGRPDEVYVNDETRQVLVVDTFTGPVESAAHNAKGWLYQNEPEIAALLKKGYSYVYMPAMWATKH